MFKFRSGTHGVNEELGRHREREGRKECLLCDAECESVSHVLWNCPAYVSIRSAFMLGLRRDRFEHFQSLDSFEKSSYVLGSEAWEEYSSGLSETLCLVYGRKGRLGYMANTLTFTSLILRMTEGCRRRGW